MAAQTYIKVLIAPAWDHNFPEGPSAWLDNVQTGSAPAAGSPAPYFHTKTGRKYTTGDKYYRSAAGGQTTEDMKYVDKWWPIKEDMGVSSSIFAYDADPRVFDSTGNLQSPTTSIGSGGFGTSQNELLFTKNRFRSTGEPMSSFNANETATLDIQLQSIGTVGSGRTCHPPYPNHWQDAVHDAIIQGSFDTGSTPVTPAPRLIYPNKPGTSTTNNATSDGNATTLTYAAFQSPKGHQAGNFWSGSGASSNVHTAAYEYTLNVTNLTHSWDTVTSVIPLPHPGAADVNTVLDPAQLNALSIDMGSMRETISVQGILDDSGNGIDTGQQPSTEKWIRRQELMDIVRAQWGATLLLQDAKESVGNPNRYVALTIGPMYTENENGDQGKTFGVQPIPITQTPAGDSYTNDGASAADPFDGYRYQLKALDMWRFGDEPHDDMRGTEYLVQDSDTPAVVMAWDWQPNYQGRRRYRGLIRNLELTLQGGSPDIWRFSFEFQVYKNETAYRRSSGIEEPAPIKNKDS